MIEPEEDQTLEEVAEGAMWATLKRRLERAGKSESLLYLRHLVKARPEAQEDGGRYARHRFGLYQRVSDYSATFNAVSGEQMSWFFDLLRKDSRADLDGETCLQVARRTAEPPGDAVLEVRDFEDQGDATVFVARWGHVHDGTPVEDDFIQVLVNARTGKPFAHHRKWHQIDTEPGER